MHRAVVQSCSRARGRLIPSAALGMMFALAQVAAANDGHAPVKLGTGGGDYEKDAEGLKSLLKRASDLSPGVRDALGNSDVNAAMGLMDGFFENSTADGGSSRLVKAPSETSARSAKMEKVAGLISRPLLSRENPVPFPLVEESGQFSALGRCTEEISCTVGSNPTCTVKISCPPDSPPPPPRSEPPKEKPDPVKIPCIERGDCGPVPDLKDPKPEPKPIFD